MSNINNEFSEFLNETRHKECEKHLDFTFLEMAMFWEYLLHMFVETGIKPNGEKASELEIAMAKESLLRIKYEKENAMSEINEE